MSEARYLRQLGLVNQRRLDDLVVLVEGGGSALPFVLQNLAMLGVGSRHGAILLEVGDRDVEESDVQGQLLLQKNRGDGAAENDVGSPLAAALIHRLARVNPETRVFSAAGRRDWPVDFHLIVPAPNDATCHQPLPDTPHLWGLVSAVSCYVGSQPVTVNPFQQNVITPSLSSLCASLLVQELLVRCHAIRRVSLSKCWTTVNYVIRETGIGAALQRGEPVMDRLRLVFQSSHGMSLNPKLSDVVNNDEIVVSVEIEDDTARLLEQSIQVTEEFTPPAPRKPIIWSPFLDVQLRDGKLIEPDVELPACIRGRRVFVAGVGALGTWLTALFAVSGAQDCLLTLVDMDQSVELHNLNRQILYHAGDVGGCKADAASARLKTLNPSLSVHTICRKIEEDFADILARPENERRTETYEQHQESGQSTGVVIPGYGPVPRSPHPLLAGELLRAHAVASCPDNMKTRWILNVACEHAQVPMINGAAQEFEGRVHRIDPTISDMCIVCREGEQVKEEERRFSCTGLEVPVQSIVTTSAAVASVQTILLMLSLAGCQLETCGFVRFSGQQNILEGYRSAQRMAEECPSHLVEKPLATSLE